MPLSLKVQDHMQPKPVVVDPDSSVFEAIHVILTNKVSGVCVVDENAKLVGMLSELDCLRAILSNTYYEGSAGNVSQFMTENVQSLKPDDDIIAVAKDMLEKKHRRRPVLQDGKLIGLLTCRQILRAVKEFSLPVDRHEYSGKD